MPVNLSQSLVLKIDSRDMMADGWYVRTKGASARFQPLLGMQIYRHENAIYDSPNDGKFP